MTKKNKFNVTAISAKINKNSGNSKITHLKSKNPGEETFKNICGEKNKADVNKEEMQTAHNIEITIIVENDVENIPQEKEIIGDKEIIAEKEITAETESIAEKEIIAEKESDKNSEVLKQN